jgi:hypothetical protein
MGRAYSKLGVCTKFWLERLKGRDHSEEIGVDDRITLIWIFWIDMVGKQAIA